MNLLVYFKGTSDNNFTNGRFYNLIKFEDNTHKIERSYFETWFINNNKGISYVPYETISAFNKNWELVEE